MLNANCPDLDTVTIQDVYPRDDPERQGVASAAMDTAYVRKYRIYNDQEMLGYQKRGELRPSWPQGKEKNRFVAVLDHHVIGVADLTELSDGWRLVEPVHVLPRFWGCGVGKKPWQACVDSAIRAGAPGLRVWSLDKNEQATKFYVGRACRPFNHGTLTLIGHPELGIAEHVEPVTGYELRLRPLSSPADGVLDGQFHVRRGAVDQ